MDRLFTVKERKDRTSFLAKRFMQYMDAFITREEKLIKEKLSKASSPQERKALLLELYSIDPFTILKKYSPEAVFNEIKKELRWYSTDRTRMRQIWEKKLNYLNSLRKKPYSQEELESKIDDYTTKAITAYSKMIDNEDILIEMMEDAFVELEQLLGVRMSFKNVSKNLTDSETNDYGENMSEEETVMAKEETAKDNWQIKVKSVSSFSKISFKVRRVLGTLPKINNNGKTETDDLLNEKYLSISNVHAFLVDVLKDITHPNDIIPILEEQSKTKKWLKPVITKLKTDNIFFSQFYTNYRLDFDNMWAITVDNYSDGHITHKTKSLNKPEGSYYLLEDWRSTINSGNVLEENYSIYNSDGTANREHAQDVKKVLDKIQKDYATIENTNKKQSNSKEKINREKLEYLKKPEVRKQVMTILRSVGIDLSEEYVYTLFDHLLTFVPQGNIKVDIDRINLILNSLSTIIDGISKKDFANAEAKAIDDNIHKDYTSFVDLINHFGSAYNELAMLFKTVSNEALESSVRELGKSYYAHTTPSYLKKLITRLKGNVPAGMTYEQWIEEEFGKYEWFKKDGVWMNQVLADLTEKYSGEDERKKIDHVSLLHYDKKEYSDLDEVELVNAMYAMYDSDPNDQYAYYLTPIMSDSGSAEFIRLKKYHKSIDSGRGVLPDVEDNICKLLTAVVIQEYNRILEVEKRYAEGVKNPINNFDKTDTNIGGAEFKFIPELNDHKVNGKSFREALAEKKASGIEEDLHRFIKNELKKVMKVKYDKQFAEWEKMGLFTKNDAGMMINFPGKKASIDSMKDSMKAFYYDYVFATSQIIQLTVTDLAYYKSMVDFQKRYKEVHSPTNKLNTEATWKDEYTGEEKKVGDDFDRVIYIKDNFSWSSVADDIEELVLNKMYNGEINALTAANIISKYKSNTDDGKYYQIEDSATKKITKVKASKINETDAQAYRTLSSYRKIMIMRGDWNNLLEDAYKRIKDGSWAMTDLDVMFQTIKPFMYTQTSVDGYKVGIQHKNSEFILMAMFESLSSGMSDKLKGLNRFMEDNNIDLVQFDSAVKVGGYHSIDINEAKTGDEVYEILTDAISNADTSNNNTNSPVHLIPLEDYGIQVSTPEHLIDTVQLMGTQIRKLIAADLPESFEVKIGDKKLTKKEWLNLYNRLITADIVNSFAEISDKFNDVREIEKLLLKEIKTSGRYGRDMIKACTLVNGEFQIPLFDPVISTQVQNILNSVIKKEVTQQKVKGGTAYLATSYTTDLKIEYEGEGDNKRIKWMECYLPAYAKELYEEFLDDNGKLDIKKMPEELKKLIGYRVPTEAKYSMAPLYVKGFLPQENGSAIMLPAEITTIAGSDFDIDKLYLILPEFRTKKIYDNKAISKAFWENSENSELNKKVNTLLSIKFNEWVNEQSEEDINKIAELDKEGIKNLFLKYRKELIKENKSLSNLLRLLKEEGIGDEVVDEYFDKYLKFREEHKEEYIKDTVIERIKYDWKDIESDDILSMSKASRHNAVLDMMWSVLTSPDMAAEFHNPGGFDALLPVKEIIEILQNNDSDTLLKTVNKTLRRDYTDINKVVEMLLVTEDMSVLQSLNKRTNSIDPLSISTHVYFHKQNMTGAKMIKIYAIHNANHALMQHLNLWLSKRYAFVLNSKTYTKLSCVKNEKGELISRITALYLAASVDNAKNPVLAALMQNEFTTDTTMLLARLGYSPLEISLLLNQPIIKEIITTYNLKRKEGKSKKEVIEDVINEYNKKNDSRIQNDHERNFSIQTLATYILNGNKINKNTIEGEIFYKDQVSVAYLFQKIFTSATALGDIVHATRYDTSGAAAGPTIADSEDSASKVTTLLENAKGVNYPIEGIFSDNSSIMIEGLEEAEGYFKGAASKEELFNKLMDSQLPYLQAFYSLGVESTRFLFAKYFPYQQKNVRDALNLLKSYTRYDRLDVRTINTFYNDLFAYIMTNTEFFGEKDKRYKTWEEKREYYMTKFPVEFFRMTKNNSKLKDYEFLNRIKYKKTNKYNPCPVLEFTNVGRLDAYLKENFIRDWTALAQSENPELRQLAYDLVVYSFFRNGFGFSPNTFTHLIPVAIRKSIPEYVEILKNFESFGVDLTDFTHQFVRNHLDNYYLVNELPEGSGIVFIKNKEIKDNIKNVEMTHKNPSLRKLMKNIEKDEEGNFIYDYVKFFKTVVGGTSVYYEINMNENGTVDFNRVSPLGYKNKFIEYSYGWNSMDFKSILHRNKLEKRCFVK